MRLQEDSRASVGPAATASIIAACRRLLCQLCTVEAFWQQARCRDLVADLLRLLPEGRSPVSAAALWSSDLPSMLVGVFEVLASSTAEQMHQQQAQALLSAVLEAVRELGAPDVQLLPPPQQQPQEQQPEEPRLQPPPPRQQQEIPQQPRQAAARGGQAAQGDHGGLRSKPSARDQMGGLFLQPLLKFLPALWYFPLSVRRQAALTLLDLVTRSKHNQRLVAAPEMLPYTDKVFRELLPATADYATQLDLVEALFRVSRSAGPHLVRRYLAGRAAEGMEGALAAFAEAAAAVDLAALLRPVLVSYNQALGSRARVFSYAVRCLWLVPRLSSGNSTSPAKGGRRRRTVSLGYQWIDVAVGPERNYSHASLHILAPPAAAGDDKRQPELLDLPYGDIEAIKIRDAVDLSGSRDVYPSAPGGPAGCEVEISLSRLPEALEGAVNVGESGDGPGCSRGGTAAGGRPSGPVSLVLSMCRQDAEDMVGLFPQVSARHVAAVRAVGTVELALSAAEGARKEVDTLERKERSARASVQALSNSISGRRSELRRLLPDLISRRVASMGQGAVRLRESVENNMHRFQRPPIGPIGTLITVSDERWRLAAEVGIGDSANNYLVSCSKDRDLMGQLIRRAGDAGAQAHLAPEHFWATEAAREGDPHEAIRLGLRRLQPAGNGFRSLLSAVIVHEEAVRGPVLFYLANRHQADGVALAATEQEAHDIVCGGAAGPHISQAIDVQGNVYIRRSGKKQPLVRKNRSMLPASCRLAAQLPPQIDSLRRGIERHSAQLRSQREGLALLSDQLRRARLEVDERNRSLEAALERQAAFEREVPLDSHRASPLEAPQQQPQPQQQQEQQQAPQPGPGAQRQCQGEVASKRKAQQPGQQPQPETRPEGPSQEMPQPQPERVLPEATPQPKPSQLQAQPTPSQPPALSQLGSQAPGLEPASPQPQPAELQSMHQQVDASQPEPHLQSQPEARRLCQEEPLQRGLHQEPQPGCSDAIDARVDVNSRAVSGGTGVSVSGGASDTARGGSVSGGFRSALSGGASHSSGGGASGAVSGGAGDATADGSVDSIGTDPGGAVGGGAGDAIGAAGRRDYFGGVRVGDTSGGNTDVAGGVTPLELWLDPSCCVEQQAASAWSVLMAAAQASVLQGQPQGAAPNLTPVGSYGYGGGGLAAQGGAPRIEGSLGGVDRCSYDRQPMGTLHNQQERRQQRWQQLLGVKRRLFGADLAEAVPEAGSEDLAQQSYGDSGSGGSKARLGAGAEVEAKRQRANDGAAARPPQNAQVGVPDYDAAAPVGVPAGAPVGSSSAWGGFVGWVARLASRARGLPACHQDQRGV